MTALSDELMGTEVVSLERELIKDARMIIIGFRPANQEAIRTALPASLEPHPDGVVLLNLWVAPHPGQSSGMGTYGRLSCGYLAPEVRGWDSVTSDGKATGHGRYFAHHWLESEGMRAYAKAACGNIADTGRVDYLPGPDGTVTIELSVDGQVVIRVGARVGDEVLDTVGGHLNYFTSRAAAEEGAEEVARIRVPYVADVKEAEVQSIEWLFDAEHPAAGLTPGALPDVVSVLYGDISWVPFSVTEVL